MPNGILLSKKKGIITVSNSYLEQGIASDTIPSHCTILFTGLIAGWILIC